MKIKNVVLGFVAASAVCVNAGWLAYEHVHPIRDAYYTDSDAVYADGMPKVVYVGGQRWNIEVGMHDEEMNEAEAFGVTLCQERAIHMHSHMTQSNERDTLIHELLHANVCKADGHLDNDAYSRGGGHAAIAMMAQFWQDIVRDNPELAEFLIHYKQ